MNAVGPFSITPSNMNGRKTVSLLNLLFLLFARHMCPKVDKALIGLEVRDYEICLIYS